MGLLKVGVSDRILVIVLHCQVSVPTDELALHMYEINDSVKILK